MALRWYVARTEPRAEFLAARELERDGFDVFLPRINGIPSRGETSDTVLFPGYLFLKCDADEGGIPLFRQAHRILGWVGFGGDVPCLPDSVVEELKDRVKELNGEDGLWQRFQPGEIVRVVGNNMDSLAEVVAEAKSPQARAKILIQFMGRLVEAQVPWQHLQKVPQTVEDAHRAPRRTRGKGRWNRGFGPRTGTVATA